VTIADLAAETVRSLRGDRRQSALALIGVGCGVAAIMTALAIGEGARREAVAEVDAMGIDNVIVRSVPLSTGGPVRALGPRLTLGDAEAIRRAAPDAVAVAPLRVSSATAMTRDRALDLTVVGTTHEWNAAIGAAMARGRWLRPVDLAARRRVVVLGAGAARQLFPGGEPLGDTVKIAGDWYAVVGILAERADPGARPSALSRFDLQRSAIVPLPDVDQRLGAADAGDRVEEIAVHARNADRVGAVASAIDGVLRQRAGARVAEIIVPRELVAARLRARRAFDAVLVAIGAVALVISGIGIMNVMLAGVARRTMEIGVRRAVGARARDIRLQFLGESAVLGAVGGAAGLAGGALATVAVTSWIGWAAAFSIGHVAIALALAIAAGVTFGVYPAAVAARWTPCEALRHG